ncbi:MAG: patatin-like phospholipase family protein [Gammaproteobacteria bacterium]
MPNQLKKELPRIENLVFQGGGMKGVAYAGAIKALEEQGCLKDVKRVAGSSAGGITALLLALGYSADEINEELSKMDFKQFQDAPPKKWWEIGFLHKISNMYTIWKTKGHGLYEGKVFKKWVKDKIEKALGNRNATFKDLHEACLREPNKFKELSVTGTNLKKKELTVFNFEKHKNVKIADAVRITMSFPGAFQNVELATGKDKNGKEITEPYSDGGIACNFPMRIYDHKKFVQKGYNLTDTGSNPCTLGFKVDSEREVSEIFWNSRSGDESDTKAEFSLTDSVYGVVGSLNSPVDEIREKYGFNTVQIFDQNVSTLDFDMGEKKKQALWQSGYEAALNWKKLYRDNVDYPLHFKEQDQEEEESEKYSPHVYTPLKCMHEHDEQPGLENSENPEVIPEMIGNIHQPKAHI